MSEFHSFVRPRVHPFLTDFCQELTGIKQKDVLFLLFLLSCSLLDLPSSLVFNRLSSPFLASLSSLSPAHLLFPVTLLVPFLYHILPHVVLIGGQVDSAPEFKEVLANMLVCSFRLIVCSATAGLVD